MYTAKQRVLAAVNHQLADRIPITFDAEIEVYEALQHHLNTQSKEELFDRLNVDTWMILPRNFIYPERQRYRPIKTSIWGYKTQSVSYDNGVYEEVCCNPLAGRNGLSDIERHPWPDDEALDFSHFPAQSAAHQDRAIIGVFTWGTFHIAALVRGMQNLLLDFALRRRYVDFLFHTISERSFFFLDKMLQSSHEHIDIVYMADDYCSQQAPLFSPQDFGRFVMPYLTRIVDKVHRYNKKFLLHVCGAVRPLLPQIIDAGVDMLEPIQTRADGMDPAELKKDFGRHICFYGGVDLQQTLCRGSVPTVVDEVKRLIDVLGKDGGYILGPGHTYIQIDAPLENILAMYETAFSYRPYQLCTV